MLYMTCEYHKSLRWLVKVQAVDRNGRYTGARNLHFCGKILTAEEAKAEGNLVFPSEPDSHAMVHNGQVVRECTCSSDRLTVAVESLQEFADECKPNPEQFAEVQERLKQPDAVTVKLAEIEIPRTVRANPFTGTDALFLSIWEKGVCVPVRLRLLGSGRFILIDGLRRVLCAIALGLKEVPAFVV